MAASLARIETALRNAHKAGDLNAARRLAAEYKRVQALGQAPAAPQVSPEAQQAALAVQTPPDRAAAANAAAQFGPGGFLGGAGDASTNAAAQWLEDRTAPAVEGVKKAAGLVSDYGMSAITGEGRRIEGVPNLLNDGATFGLGPIDQAQLAGSLVVANDRARQRQAVWDAFPNAKIYDDGNGYDVVEIDGKKAYINGPGVSQQDIVDLGLDAVMFMPFGKAYSAAARMPGAIGSLLGRMGVGAGAGAATSVAQDVTSNVLGDGEGVSLKRAGLYAAGGAGGEAIAVGANRLSRQLGQGGKATEAEAREAATKMGLDYDALDPAVQGELRGLTRQARDPGRYARQLEASNQPAGAVPLTRARASIPPDPKLALAEKHMLKAGDPEVMARTQNATDALLENLNFLKTGSPDSAGLTAARGGEMVSDRLAGMRAAEKANMDKLYSSARSEMKAARSAGTEPFAERGDMIDLVRSVRNGLADEGLNHRTAPAVWEALADINPGLPTGETTSARDVGLSRILESIASLKQLARSSGAPEARHVAAGRAATRLQEGLDDMFEQGIMRGDDAVLRLFKDANYARRRYGDRWEANDIIDKLTRKDPKGRGDQLAVAPEKAIDAIFGTSTAGLTSNRGMRRELRALKARLGVNSPEWDAMRQAAIDRFVNPIVKEGDLGMEVSGVRLRAAWVKAQKENPEVLAELFTPQQQAAMNSFTKVADWATRSLTGVDHSTNNMRAITSSIANSGYRMGTAGMAPAWFKWLGAVPVLGPFFASREKEAIARKVLGALPLDRMPASERSRILSAAAGAGLVGPDAQGQQ